MDNEQKSNVSGGEKCGASAESLECKSERYDEVKVFNAGMEEDETIKLTRGIQDTGSEDNEKIGTKEVKPTSAGKDDNNDPDMDEIQKAIETYDMPSEPEKHSPVHLVDSTSQCITIESVDASEIDMDSSKIVTYDRALSNEVENADLKTTDDPIECEFESPEKNVNFMDSTISENAPITLNSSTPCRERSVSVSSTDRDIGSDKANEIFELTDDEEDEGSDHTNRNHKFVESTGFDDDVESDTFENSSESMSDEDPMDDEYDSGERIHSIDDSDDDEVSIPHAVRRKFSLFIFLVFITNFKNFTNLFIIATVATYDINEIKQYTWYKKESTLPKIYKI